MNAQERIGNLLPDPHDTARSIEAQAVTLYRQMIEAELAYERELKATTVHLQGIGRIKAKPADQFQPGETTVWNYGGLEYIVAIRDVSPAYLEFDMLPIHAGQYDKPGTRRLKKSRMVAYR
jgi:lipoprotein NlpI